jgi:hypothetical protein
MPAKAMQRLLALLKYLVAPLPAAAGKQKNSEISEFSIGSGGTESICAKFASFIITFASAFIYGFRDFGGFYGVSPTGSLSSPGCVT